MKINENSILKPLKTKLYFQFVLFFVVTVQSESVLLKFNL